MDLEARQPVASIEYIKLLLWLKWKVMIRGYLHNKTAAVGVVAAVIFFAPMALVVGVGLGAGFRGLSTHPPYDEHLLRAALTGIALIWVLGPSMGYSLNESYDITRLFVYPISYRQIFSGAILGSFMDFTVWMLLPSLVAVVVGFGGGVLGLSYTIVILFLFVFQTVAFSQAFLILASVLMQSRRFRDTMVVLIPLVSVGVYFLMRLEFFRLMSRLNWRSFLSSAYWEALTLLPPGIAARGIAAVSRGDLVFGLFWMLMTAVITATVVYAAGWVIQKVFEGEQFGSGRPRKKLEPASPSAAVFVKAPRLFGFRLPPVVEAMADKEMKYIIREPYFKVMLINLLYIAVFAVFAFILPLWRGGFGRSSGFATVPVLTAMIMLYEAPIVMNAFGIEGSASATLFGFPGSRRQMLIAKNLVHFVALTPFNCILVLFICLLARLETFVLPALMWVELTLGVAISAGNLMSPVFPARVAVSGRRVQTQVSAGEGYARSFVYLGAMAGIGGCCLPVAALIGVPLFVVNPIWLGLTIPVAVSYVLGLYLLSLNLAEPVILSRETLMIERLSASL